MERNVVAFGRKEYQNCDRLWKWYSRYRYCIFSYKKTQIPLYLPPNQMYSRVMTVLIFIFVTVISPTVCGTLTITDHEYSLINYTKLISEEHFTAGCPLVIVLPLAEEYLLIWKWKIWLRNCKHQVAGLYWCLMSAIRWMEIGREKYTSMLVTLYWH